MQDAVSWPLTVPTYVLALVVGYLFGSIPFGLLLTRSAGLGDVRAIGSGNIGATNVLRTGRKGLAAATLLCDALKGTIPVLIGAWFSPWAGLIAGFGAFLGHLFPIWLRFRGGKGVSTYIGVTLAVFWPAMLIFAAAWLAVAWFFRYSSLAALVATLTVPITLYGFGRLDAAVVFAAMTAIVWAKHHGNIGRLMSGTESKIGGKT